MGSQHPEPRCSSGSVPNEKQRNVTRERIPREGIGGGRDGVPRRGHCLSRARRQRQPCPPRLTAAACQVQRDCLSFALCPPPSRATHSRAPTPKRLVWPPRTRTPAGSSPSRIHSPTPRLREAAFDQLQAAGVTPSIVTYAFLISAYDMGERWQKAKEENEVQLGRRRAPERPFALTHLPARVA